MSSVDPHWCKWWAKIIIKSPAAVLCFNAPSPQWGVSLPFNLSAKSMCVRRWGDATLYVSVHQHSVRFPQRQHNPLWKMSSCTEHDLRFHLLLKCLECRRIPAELAALLFSFNSMRCWWLCQCHHIQSKGVCCTFFEVSVFKEITFGRHLWNLRGKKILGGKGCAMCGELAPGNV